MTGTEYFKKAHPAISWVVIFAALSLGGNAMYSANAVENLALANEKDIFYEREIRIVSSEVLKEDLGELKTEIGEVKKELKAETTEIKRLLNELLLQRAASPPN